MHHLARQAWAHETVGQITNKCFLDDVNTMRVIRPSTSIGWEQLTDTLQQRIAGFLDTESRCTMRRVNRSMRHAAERSFFGEALGRKRTLAQVGMQNLDAGPQSLPRYRQVSEVTECRHAACQHDMLANTRSLLFTKKLTQFCLIGHIPDTIVLDAIYAQTQLQSLTLSTANIGDHGALRIAEKRSIRFLSLDINPIGMLGLQALANHASLTALSLRAIPQLRVGANVPLFWAFSRQKTLTALMLDDNNLNCTAAIILSQSQTITHLGVKGNAIASRGANALALSKKLSWLNIEDNPLSSESAQQFAENKHLTALSLSVPGVRFFNAAPLLSSKSLIRLKLRVQSISADSLRRARRSTLTELSLPGCRMDAALIKGIVQMCIPTLIADIAHSPDASFFVPSLVHLKAMASIRNFNDLQSLCIHGSTFCDWNLHLLPKKLASLELIQCHGITAPALYELTDRGLHSLTLVDTPLHDRGAQILAKGETPLCLTLYDTGVGYVGVCSLTKRRGPTTLHIHPAHRYALENMPNQTKCYSQANSALIVDSHADFVEARRSHAYPSVSNVALRGRDFHLGHLLQLPIGLTCLVLKDCDSMGQEALSLLSQMPESMMSLSLDNTHFDSPHFVEFARAARFSRLIIANAELSVETAEALAINPKLTILVLRSITLSQGAIAALSHTKTIRTLSIDSTLLTPSNATLLASNRSLERIDIVDGEVSFATLEQLASIPTLCFLKANGTEFDPKVLKIDAFDTRNVEDLVAAFLG